MNNININLAKRLFRKHNITKKVKLSPLVKDDQNTPFSIATTPKCKGGRYSFPWIAPLYL